MIQIDEPMPKSCRSCPFRDLDLDYCILYSWGLPERWDVAEKYVNNRPEWCELKEVL